MKVLVVDDSGDNLYYLSSVLEGVGYEVISAYNGKEALECLGESDVELIISDILMPVMDGFILCRECKTNPVLSHIPFIFYTATYTGQEDRNFGLSLGAQEYLIKPLEPEALLASIERIVEDYDRGRYKKAVVEDIVEQPDYLAEYNKRLIQKLERKMLQLEESARELQEERYKLQMLSDNAPFGMVLMTGEGRFTYMNKKFQEMFGYGPSDIPDGSTWLMRAYPDNHTRERAAVVWKDEMMDPGSFEPAKHVLPVTCHDGTQKTVSFIPLKLESGDYLVTCEDITEVKRLEKQLQQSQKMEAIGNLAGGIAHDFNNILTTIMGYAGLLQMEMDKHNPLELYVNQIVTASQKAANLIRSLLAFSRQQPVVLNPMSINEMIRSSEKLLKRLLAEDVELKVSLAPDTMVIMADGTQIDQILFNLAANARDAMPSGGGTVIIATSSVVIDKRFVDTNGFGAPGEYAVITVFDTGIGMTEAVREKVFDPFFTTKETGKGTGLGLSTVYGIVKQHNGFINVYSEPGNGTTFRIYFPLVSADTLIEQEETPVIQKGTETILVAEDDNQLRQLVKEVLGKYGYKIIEAVDGDDAIVKFRQHRRVDLMIVDSVMPKKNGRQVYEAVKKTDPAVKVLFTSGHMRDTVLSRGIAQSGFDFLPKPVSPIELLTMVRKILDKK